MASRCQRHSWTSASQTQSTLASLGAARARDSHASRLTTSSTGASASVASVAPTGTSAGPSTPLHQSLTNATIVVEPGAEQEKRPRPAPRLRAANPFNVGVPRVREDYFGFEDDDDEGGAGAAAHAEASEPSLRSQRLMYGTHLRRPTKKVRSTHAATSGPSSRPANTASRSTDTQAQTSGQSRDAGSDAAPSSSAA